MTSASSGRLRILGQEWLQFLVSSTALHEINQLSGWFGILGGLWYWSSNVKCISINSWLMYSIMKWLWLWNATVLNCALTWDKFWCRVGSCWLQVVGQCRSFLLYHSLSHRLLGWTSVTDFYLKLGADDAQQMRYSQYSISISLGHEPVNYHPIQGEVRVLETELGTLFVTWNLSCQVSSHC